MAADFFQGRTKTALTNEIRELLKQYGLNEEFESTLIQELISEKHYYLSTTDIVPTKFRKAFASPPAPYNFEGFFPDRGWWPVSWTKCVEEPGSRQFLTQALRDASRPWIAQYKRKHRLCELCAEPAVDVDHVSPEFKDLVEISIGPCSPEEIAELMSGFDFWNDKPFEFPHGTSAYKRFVDAHESLELMAVCKACHLNAAKARRKQ